MKTFEVKEDGTLYEIRIQASTPVADSETIGVLGLPTKTDNSGGPDVPAVGVWVYSNPVALSDGIGKLQRAGFVNAKDAPKAEEYDRNLVAVTKALEAAIDGPAAECFRALVARIAKAKAAGTMSDRERSLKALRVACSVLENGVFPLPPPDSERRPA